MKNYEDGKLRSEGVLKEPRPARPLAGVKKTADSIVKSAGTRPPVRNQSTDHMN